MTQDCYINNTVSPAFSNGVLSWCEGDVFAFYIRARLSSAGAPIDDLTGYTAEVRFSHPAGGVVHTFACDLSDGRARLDFTSAVTAKFCPGRYVYDVTVIGTDGARSTVASDCPAVVR